MDWASRAYRTLQAGVLLGALAVPPAVAQGAPLSVQVRQDLTFGTVIRGVATTVSRFDAANAAQWRVRGVGDTEVRIDITLPNALIAAAASLPLQFAGGDGGYSDSNSFTGSLAFDPHLPLIATLPKNGQLYVFLGGTAIPGPQQPIGTYTATITLSVAYTGN